MQFGVRIDIYIYHEFIQYSIIIWMENLVEMVGDVDVDETIASVMFHPHK